MAFYIGNNIRKIREAKGLSQKEVITAIKMGAAQYSRIEGNKTDPSVATLARIAKALGIALSELFTFNEQYKDTNSADKTIMEKVALVESLSKEEKKVVYTILDAFIAKRKLKDTLASVLNDVK